MAEYLPAQLEKVRKPVQNHEAPVRKEPAPVSHPLVSLQARAGNQAIARMIQRAGPEEEEVQAKHDPALQRESEGEEEEIQEKHDPTLQRESEGEEEEIQEKHDPTLQRESEGEEEEIQEKHDPTLLRESEGEEEEIQEKHDPALQREDDNDDDDNDVQMKHDPAPKVGLEGGAVGADISDRVNSMRGGGSGLSGGIRDQMESATGTDLSGVRVHQDKESDSLNRQLTAKAFTTGSDIFLRSDASQGDNHLMAHELAHVVQQSSGRVASGGEGMTAGAANDPLEAEADKLADSVLSGQAQRQAEETRA